MNKKQPPDPDEAAMHFRSMRRRSKPQGGASDITNIFGQVGEDQTDTRASGQSGPAHVEAEKRQFGRLRVLLAPKDCPENLSEALRSKVAKLDRFCSAAYLFQAGYDNAEDALMICLTDVDEESRARIEGAIADVLVASGHEDHALGVLFLPSDHRSTEHIRRVSLVLKATH